MDSKDLLDVARDHKLSWSTLKRAKKDAGVISRKNDDGITWTWRLKRTKGRGKGTKNAGLLVP